EACVTTLGDLLGIENEGDLLHLVHGLNQLAGVVRAGTHGKLHESYLTVEVAAAYLLFTVGVALLDMRKAAGVAERYVACRRAVAHVDIGRHMFLSLGTPLPVGRWDCMRWGMIETETAL